MAFVWRLKCPKHNKELIVNKTISFNIDGEITKYPMFFCDECKQYYIHTNAVTINSSFDYGEYSVLNTESKPYQVDDSHNEKSYECKVYGFQDFIVDSIRKSTKDVEQYLINFETCQHYYKKNFPYSLLHYAFIFRRFDIVNHIVHSLSIEEWNYVLHTKGCVGYEWITPLICAKWNLNYLLAYDDKNNTNLFEKIEMFLDEVEHIDEVMEYTDEIDKDRKTIFDIFWNKTQPLLDVEYFKKQELASKQVINHGVSIVMDEVGTGKTVSALYSIRNIINEKNKENKKAKVLIICPYNKREDWQNDIRRQIGRYAHIVEQKDNGVMYYGDLKQVFFKNKEHIIMIAGQKQGVDKEGIHTALKGSLEKYSNKSKWDLVIIDEAHISFQNYFGILSEKAMLLTATPIVLNAKEKRTFEDYIKLLHKITGINLDNKQIEPIHCSMPKETDIYVNWFREDMGKNSAKRNIQFISCKRHPKRNEIYYRIKNEVGELAALAYDQDDNYLFYNAIERYGYTDVKEIIKNNKLEKLVQFLKTNSKSYIIFCEHQYVVNLLFERLKDEFIDDVVAEKFGKIENQCGLENVQSGQLINTLMQALRVGKRVIFIVTGKTGGTGLNLGEFDGVIHYELPFTSIELEQRFGRVDRIDTKTESKNRDMIFLLNECRADENDIEVNRMLYYCATKIDITCRFLPVRNTILYYPQFIKRNREAIRASLEYFQQEQILSEENEKKIRNLNKQKRLYENEIRENNCWNEISHLGKNIGEVCIQALRLEKNHNISDNYYELLNEYIKFLRSTKAERIEYQNIYKQFLEARKYIKNWFGIIGLMELDKNGDIFVGYHSTDDEAEQVLTMQTKENHKEKIFEKGNLVQKQIQELILLVEKSNFQNIEEKNFYIDGIFCYYNNTIKRLSVKEYRLGNEWK